MPPVPNAVRRFRKEFTVARAFVDAFRDRIQQGPSHLPPPPPVAPGAMRIWAHGVNLYIDDQVFLKLRGFVADLQPFDPSQPLCPDARDSYQLVIRAGQIRLSADSMEALLNRYVLPGLGHPLREARLSLEGDRLVLRGKVPRFGIHLPVTIESHVRMGDTGRLVLTPDRIAVSEVGLGGVLKLFKMDLASLMSLPPDGAIAVEHEELTLDPTAIFPEPKAVGTPTVVTVERGELVLGYEPEAPIPIPEMVDPDAENYLLGVGHDLHVGKMILKDAYFQVVNIEAARRLDFSLDRYREQLTGGTSSLRPGDRLLVRVPNLAARTPSPPPEA